MSRPPFIKLVGASGTNYDYWDLQSPRDASTIQDQPGNYAFLKKLPNGNYLPVYIGQADSLKNRLPNHERMGDAILAGAIVLVAHTTPGGEQVRLAEEKDLVSVWNPVLNTQHRTAG